MMKYQLVLEFFTANPEDFQRVINLEIRLEDELHSGEVDGNDVGQGIANIFILTNEPERCFQDAMHILSGTEPPPNGAGYRELRKEDFVRLWPKGDTTPFILK